MNNYNKQNGMALILSLIILITVSLLAVSGIKRSGIETKIVGISLNRALLFNAALTETETVLSTLNYNIVESDKILLSLMKGFTIENNKQKFINVDVQGFDKSKLKTKGIDITSEMRVIHKGADNADGESINSNEAYTFVLKTEAKTVNNSSKQESGYRVHALKSY